MDWSNQVNSSLQKTQKIIFGLSKVMAFIAAFSLLSMMMLTVIDVSGRYFFKLPLNGAWEIIGLMLVCVGSWGLAHCQVEKEHIRVTFLLERLPHKMQIPFRVLAYLTGIASFIVLSINALKVAIRYITTQGNMTDTLHIPYFPFMLIMAFGAAVLVLVLVLDLVRSLMEVSNR
jgi:TRAP-type C4-dicarboxylate transport system permease small subunit